MKIGSIYFRKEVKSVLTTLSPLSLISLLFITDALFYENNLSIKHDIVDTLWIHMYRRVVFNNNAIGIKFIICYNKFTYILNLRVWYTWFMCDHEYFIVRIYIYLSGTVILVVIMGVKLTIVIFWLSDSYFYQVLWFYIYI